MSNYPFYNAQDHIKNLANQAQQERLIQEARKASKKASWWGRWFSPVKSRPETCLDEAVRLSPERRAELISQEGLSGFNC